MRITCLGTGAAGGVPLYGCRCAACERAHGQPEYRRRPCSALIEAGGERWLIDAGLMDLHERFPPGRLAGVLLTHFHADHVQGLFHLRWGVGERLRVFAPPDPEGCADLYKHPGLLHFQTLDAFQTMQLGALRVTPLPLAHSRPTFGYAVESPAGQRVAYLTDTLGLPADSRVFLQTWRPDLMLLDCSDPPRTQPRNHNDWDTALAIIDLVAPRRTLLTHLNHTLDAWLLETRPDMPATVAIARDDQVVDLVAETAR